MSCAAGPFVCVPSLLGPSERVEARAAQSGWLIASSCLCLSDLVWIYSVWSVSAGPDVPPAREYIAQPVCLSTCLPTCLRHASYGTDGGGGGDCLGRLGGVWPTHRLFGCGSCVVAFSSILPMSRWRRSSAAETDVRFSTGDTVVRPSSCLGFCAPIQCDLEDYENFQDLVVL